MPRPLVQVHIALGYMNGGSLEQLLAAYQEHCQAEECGAAQGPHGAAAVPLAGQLVGQLAGRLVGLPEWILARVLTQVCMHTYTHTHTHARTHRRAHTRTHYR